MRSIRTSRCPASTAARQHHPAPSGELLVQRRRDAVGRRGDRDRVERSAVGRAAGPVADPHLDVVGGPSARAPARARAASAGIRSIESDARRESSRTAAAYPEPVPTSSTASSPSSASSSHIVATMKGCEIVWSSPIGSAASSYAALRELDRHERLARHAAHRVEHALVRDPPPPELALDHPGAERLPSRACSPSVTPRAASRRTARRRRSARARPARRRRCSSAAGPATPCSQDRDERVARDERAVRAAAAVVAAAEVLELPSLRPRTRRRRRRSGIGALRSRARPRPGGRGSPGRRRSGRRPRRAGARRRRAARRARRPRGTGRPRPTARRRAARPASALPARRRRSGRGAPRGSTPRRASPARAAACLRAARPGHTAV